MTFELKFDPLAQEDIQKIISYYNSAQEELGQEFFTELKEYYTSLKTNPFYEIRYSNVRCLPLKRFPYMIHFVVDETSKVVKIRAVFGTSESTVHWSKRK